MKSEYETDAKTGKRKRKALFSKNDYCRSLLAQAIQNQLKFRYVLTDIWFTCGDTMKFIHHELNKYFVMPLKANRKIAVNLEDKMKGQYARLDSLQIQEGTVQEIWLEGLDFPLILAKQVFTNADNSTGTLYLVSNDNGLSYDPLSIKNDGTWNAFTNP